MNKVSTLFVALSFSLSAFAVDLPSVDEGANQLNMDECVANNYQQCLNDICITSDEIDCNSNCQSMAEDKCQQQADD